MSRLLSNLLGVDDHDFKNFIDRVEGVTLHDGVDIRLTTEIITKSREAVRGLGLDPKDSTHEEVYWALRSKALEGDRALRQSLNISEAQPDSMYTVEESAMASKSIASSLNTLLINERVICVQTSAIKKILHAVPPKKTLRTLSFRSISSVLRREDPRCLYAIALLLETDSWRKQAHAQLKRLKAKDVMEQAPEIVALPKAWVEKLEDQDFSRVSISVPEIGSIVLLPSVPLSIPGTVLLTSAIALQAVQTMVVESLPYRSQALSAGLESLIPEIAVGHVKLLNKVHGMQPSWQAVYQLLSTKDKQLPEFEFILQDLSWESTEVKLSSLSSELDYWVDKHFLGYATSGLPVSFHVIDVTVSEVLNKAWGDQIVSHMRASIWNELQIGYLQHETFEKAVIQQLTFAQELVL